jgi:hypothetical protein
MRTWLRFVLIVWFAVSGACAKRTPPPVVTPITHNGVVYSATADGETAFVVAADEKTGKELWKAEVYRIQIDPTKEVDVQTIFISGIRLSGEKLLIQDEAGRCYRLDLETRQVQGINCKKYRALRPAV